MDERISNLIQLSRELGREERRLGILGEGNTSVRLSPTQFAVKASGCSLATLSEGDVTVCETEKLLALLDERDVSDAALERALLEARVENSAKKPSIEAMFHAWLLTLEGVDYVGHCHSLPANQILCSPRAREFAERRMFPDEIVCCGSASVFVPYADPGLPLAREIREHTRAFIRERGFAPRLILLQNHGLIALGTTPNAVLACTLMATKAAEIFVGAAALGGPKFLEDHDVQRIAGRQDEAYRQRQLGL
jgi:rhamnose utilization protein RhaD (predicted bifunctional aldolase and dehydrogenase)